MANPPLEQGSALMGRWVIRSPIGAGAFGVVYSALDRYEQEPVAVKTLHPGKLNVPDLVDRFQREAEICAMLQHPNTAQFRHFGQYRPEGTRRKAPFMVFELVRGLPMGKLLQVRGPLSSQETCVVLIQVLESLAEAHELGILHRDLKPDNILAVAPEHLQKPPQFEGDNLFDVLGIPGITNPCWSDLTKLEVKVLDFGLGKVLEIGERKVKHLTAAGVAPGTANYMSPEQASGESLIDYRADIYGVAMLMHRLLTGTETYTGESAIEVAMAHIQKELPDLPGALADDPISDVFKRAGAKNPDDRYGSAAEMEWALHCVLDPALKDEPEPDFKSPPEVVAKRHGLFKRLFGR